MRQKHGPLPYIQWEGMRGTSQVKFRISCLNYFSEIWGPRATPSCLVSGPGV